MSARGVVDGGRVAASHPAGRQTDRRWLRVENTQLRARVRQLEGEHAVLRETAERLDVRLQRALATVAELRRAAKRQAAPFSRETRKPNPSAGGRKPGAAYGTKARRLAPDPGEVDEVVAVGLPVCCPDCGGAVVFEKMVPQHQEELVPAQRLRRCYQVALGHCAGCKRAVRSRHDEQTSDALGAAGVMLGPRARALAAWLHYGCGVSMGKVAKILLELAGITVTAGGLFQALHTMAADADATYQALLTALRGSTAVSADETGWRVDATREWLWVYVGDTVTVYDIAAGRGYEQAKAILGEDFAGVLERDGWASYGLFEAAEHQSCIAHLLRRCRELIDDSVGGQAKIPHELRRILLDALNARQTPCDGRIRRLTIIDLQARLDAFCRRQPGHDPNRKLVKHIRRERPHLLTFLTHAGVEATNWESEHGVRAMIGIRKLWGGNKTWNGAHTMSILGSILRTSQQQNVDPIQVLIGIQRTGQVPPQFALPTAGPSP